MAGEAIVIVFVIRNSIGCLIGSYITAWFQGQGLRRAYGELVAVAYIVLALWLAMYVFGRRVRVWTDSFGPMARATGC